MDLRKAIYSIVYDNFDVVDEKYDLFGCLHQYFFHKTGYVTYVLFDTVENKYFYNKYDNDLYGSCPEELLEQKIFIQYL